MLTVEVRLMCALATSRAVPWCPTQYVGLSECDDPHPRSLLTLIARALEDDDPTPLLGLAECTEPELALRALPIQTLTSPATHPDGTITSATAHGSLDNDRAVMERVVRNLKGVD